MPELCLSSSSRPPAWLSCPGSCQFPQEFQESWDRAADGGGAPTRAGSHRLSEPEASERDGASASLSSLQTFMEHLCVHHTGDQWGSAVSQDADSALLEPTGHHRCREWMPTQWTVGPGGSGRLADSAWSIPSWGSPGRPRCSWDPDPQRVRSSASGMASWGCSWVLTWLLFGRPCAHRGSP